MQQDLDLVRRSGLFDAAWYCEQYPDVRILGMDPAEHYLRFGWLLGRMPSGEFDLSKYGLSANDLKRRNPIFLVLEKSGELARLSASVEHHQSSMQKPTSEALEADGSAKGDKHLSDYELIASEFDVNYYLRRYPDIARAKIDPVKHYLKHGGFELRSPNADFDPKYYVEHNPDVKSSKINPFLHYLRVGRAEGRPSSPLGAGNPHFDRIASMLDLHPAQLQSAVEERKRDIRARLSGGELGEMVHKAAALDPLIRHVWNAALNPGISPIRSPGWNHQIGAMYDLQEQAEWKRAKVVVLVPWLHMMSGAARSASFLATALADIYGPEEVLIIRTETSELQLPDWFPPGCRHIDMAAVTQGLETSLKERLLVEYVRSLRPQHVFNVNSRTFWGAMEHFGVALSKSVSLHTYFFCNEKNINGDWVGYPVRHYHKYADILSSVMCDSHFLAEELSSRFLIPREYAERLHVLASPINTQVKPVIFEARQEGSRPRVYWAGRFDRQKRVDVAFAIAEKMPDVDFHFWGKPTLDKAFEKLKKPANVKLEGVYQAFDELPLSKCDAWLYTAEWDGVPNMLLEVASAAVPLVGSIAGGTGEVLMDGYSEPVRNIENVDEYVSALRRTFEQPEEMRARALKLREIILARHSRRTYLKSVKTIVRAGDADA